LEVEFLLIVPLILSFLVTFLLTPFLSKVLRERGIVGVDLHKEEKQYVPEMVGIAILIGFTSSTLVAYLILKSHNISPITLVALLTGFLGIIDGFKKLTALQKIVFLSLIGAILIPYSNLEILGYDVGVFYLLLVPILFMCLSNFTNMLAGFNGLEIGTGAIATAGLAVISFLDGKELSFLISTGLLGSLIAFLYYNKYPAKVFPGDVGTLIIGAVLFSCAVIDQLDLIVIGVLFFPYILDAWLKYFSAGVMTRESQSPTIVKEGKLYIPENSNLSLPRLILKIKPFTEKEIVLWIWLIEAVFSGLAILVSFAF